MVPLVAPGSVWIWCNLSCLILTGIICSLSQAIHTTESYDKKVINLDSCGES